MNVGWDQNEGKMGLMKGEWSKILRRMGLR